MLGGKNQDLIEDKIIESRLAVMPKTFTAYLKGRANLNPKSPGRVFQQPQPEVGLRASCCRFRSLNLSEKVYCKMVGHEG